MNNPTSIEPHANPLASEADSFIRDCYRELGESIERTEQRIRQIHEEVARTGTYTHTLEELAHGARMAWRNSNRCIGRLFWNRLHVFDCRGSTTEQSVYEALLRHIEYATNGGEIRSTITVFPPSTVHGNPIRIWNHQLIRYAGYVAPDGGIVGDPASVAFTKACESLGWRGDGTAFDLLPLVIQCGDNAPKVFELPKDIVVEVPIRHPEIDLFPGDVIKWYAVPIIADMRLEIGGISYAAAPFNGWYMGTEIGARNLADKSRYDLLPRIAAAMGLDMSSSLSLWQDRALVELNAAVLHSFRQHGVSIVDHHTAAQQLGTFRKNEEKEGRDVTGRWSWLIPPMSPATTDIFHSSFEDRVLNPNYWSQPAPY
ncbi:nitric oxide synthase oxygenase [Cohnella yongneupensis]|uniref:Nitric oxide synthase oxygenase n=1 Tax=Cohnella yongneupensis TaxID=425006 RepID=A0ABW0R3A6_9BACL